MSVMHYYVFRTRQGEALPFYERTCGTVQAAKWWIEEYTRRGSPSAFYTTNSLPTDYFS